MYNWPVAPDSQLSRRLLVGRTGRIRRRGHPKRAGWTPMSHGSMSFCRLLAEFYDVFLSSSSIHGLRYLSPTLNPRLSERLVWYLFLGGALLGIACISEHTLGRFMRSPTVVSMERNYLEWNTSFPSITLCPTVKYSQARIQQLLQTEFGAVKYKEGLADLLEALANSSYGRLSDLPDWPQSHPRPADYWKLLPKIAFPFFYNVSNSNMEAYGQTQLTQVMTESGLCYSYNSAATLYNDPQMWASSNMKYLGKINIFKGSPLDGDIFAQVMNMNSGYSLYLLDPHEFPDIAQPPLEGANNSYKTLDLTALSTVISPAAERLSVQQRRCRLPAESQLTTSPVYSYNLCRMECRIQAAHRLCGCIPFFYRPNSNYRICNAKGMQCLDDHSELLVKMLDPATGRKLPCDCLPLCNEVNYIMDTDNTMAWTLGTNLKWGLIKYPKFRLKRDVLFGWTDLFVSIGGTAGLFLGCSLLSFAEIFYFLSRRFAWFVFSWRPTKRRKRRPVPSTEPQSRYRPRWNLQSRPHQPNIYS